MGNSIGATGLAIPQLYLRAAIDLIIQGAIKLRLKNKVDPKKLENRITRYLSAEMVEAQREGCSDILNWDYRVNTQYDADDHDGELDFKFRWHTYPAEYDRYLAVEAKRLFGKGTTRASEYVDKGVMDFVDGKYSLGHDYGVMLGYILIGPQNKVVNAVKRAMNTRSRKTNELSKFSLEKTICTHPDTHHSIHMQHKSNRSITLVHVFLDFSNPIALNSAKQDVLSKSD